MKNRHYSSGFWLLLIAVGLSLLDSSCAQQHEAEPLQVYIVYIGEHSGAKMSNEIKDDHHSYLLSVKGSEEEARDSLIYSYKNVINGFSAVLTPDEAAQLSEMEGVVSVFPSHPRKHRLQTTRSWDFVSLLEGGQGGDHKRDHHPYEELLKKANHGKDVIVGVLDTGIWPESPSFSDEGMEPIPDSWKGICQTGDAFNKSHCNRKIIGARYYLESYERRYGQFDNSNDNRSARDKNSHGTHVASTVGGRMVPNTSAYGGFARGTATGGAPLVRLAIYKVCWHIKDDTGADANTCLEDEILAAIDDAIADGVQVLSLSIAGNGSIHYDLDPIALGTLQAEKRNIVVVSSAGNDGPVHSTVSNVAPWILTVAASSIDRSFPSAVLLGNQMKIEAQTVTPFKLRKKMHQLVYASDVEVPGTTPNITGLCLPGTLSRRLVRGKIVICLGTNAQSAWEVRRARGAGIIQTIPPVGGIRPSLAAQVLPAVAIPWSDIAAIINYTRDTKNATAKLVPGMTVLGSNIPAPFMAPFSSLGPNGLQPNILKPDIAAPGLNILAAWSEKVSPSKLAADHQVVKYNFESGTSMSCPHVSAVAALLKAIHPDWSSAAIRSALMTTAGQNNNMGTPIMSSSQDIATPFHYGSGHVQPAKAMDPGLVYDATYTDYLLFLCGTNYDLDPTFTCPVQGPLPSNLNYPSLAISELNGSMTVMRTVTNVGSSTSAYSLTVKSPTNFTVEIFPTILSFSQVGEKKNFYITVKAESAVKTKPPRGMYSFGWYMWSDGIHVVRSPIAVSSA